MVCAQRLDKGRFCWPGSAEGVSIRIQPEELAMLLGGLDLGRAKPRYREASRLHENLFLNNVAANQ